MSKLTCLVTLTNGKITTFKTKSRKWCLIDAGKALGIAQPTKRAFEKHKVSTISCDGTQVYPTLRQVRATERKTKQANRNRYSFPRSGAVDAGIRQHRPLIAA